MCWWGEVKTLKNLNHSEVLEVIQRDIHFQTLDNLWMNHLEQMEHTRQGSLLHELAVHNLYRLTANIIVFVIIHNNCRVIP